MSATATKTDSQPGDLELNRIQEELSRNYNPANGFEQMLVSAVAQAWLRLERAQQAEQRYCATRDMVEVLTTKLAEFKAVTKWVTDCDRGWRNAVALLEQTQRRRQKDASAAAPSAKRLQSRPAASPSRPTAIAPVQAPESSPVAPARRE